MIGTILISMITFLFLLGGLITLAGYLAYVIRLFACRKCQACTKSHCPAYHYCDKIAYAEKKKQEIQRLKIELQKYCDSQTV